MNKQNTFELVRRMTLEEKISLLSGRDFWHTKGVERLGLYPVTLTDGPHGLRLQAGGAVESGIGSATLPSTCFPAACASACSFDPALLYEMGKAIGEECRSHGVAVVLGPGINIKRSPLGGRNFEYFSEDPFLSGELAAAFIRGVESRGVGASLKHFALNNQETRRMSSESAADPRAFREIYLSGFERAVKEGKPSTLMCSYNKLYGSYAGDSRLLLTEILREEWGFQGLVMSDWGAMNDPVAAVQAGLDLEMPGPSRSAALREAVLSGALREEELDRSVTRVVQLILKGSQVEQAPPYDQDAHHALARRIARESAVLLKNDGLLPGNAGQKAAVIGAFAKFPRYQGSGSSKINPTRLDNALDALQQLGLCCDYAPGYSLYSDRPDEALIKEACQTAQDKDIIYLFAGLPDSYESEGFDREHLFLPESHAALIRRVAEANQNLVVVLLGGGVMDTSWSDCARAVLLTYLGGQAGAAAAAELLLGEYSPSGKLAESWCEKLEDNPSYAYFPGYPKSVEYRESIFVGYRYYDTARVSPAYPFGHGLSYTSFAYQSLTVQEEGENLRVGAEIENTGGMAGGEAVQLYVAREQGVPYRAAQELKGFSKVFLRPGEKKRVEFVLTPRSFSFYDVNLKDWRVEEGVYELRLSSSSRDARLKTEVFRRGTSPAPLPDHRAAAPCYYDLSKGMDVPEAAFLVVYGAPLPRRESRRRGEPFTQNSTMKEMREKWLGRLVFNKALREMAKIGGADASARVMMERTFLEAPLRFMLMGGGRFTPKKLEGLVRMLNNRFLSGLFLYLRG